MDSAWLDGRLWSLTRETAIMWVLVLTRVTGLLAVLPGLGQERIPLRVRAFLAAFIALILAPVVPRPDPLPLTGPVLAWDLVTELLAGILLGTLVGWILEAVSFAGQLMDLQVGFSFAQLLDPATSQTVTPAGVLLAQLTLLFMFVSGLHHTMILSLVESYRILPIGQGLPDRAMMLIPLLGQLLAKGLQLAFPVLVTLFLIDVLAGVSSKIMPQLQIFQLTFPLKIGVGVFILAFLLRGLSDWLLPLFQEVPRLSLKLLGG